MGRGGARVQREAVSAIERAGGSVSYDVDWIDGTYVVNDTSWPQWLTDALGRNYLESVTRVEAHRGVGDAEMRHIGRLKRLVALQIAADDVTDAGLSQIQGLSRLRWLDLHAGSKLTAAALRHIEPLSNLEALNLVNFPVTDDKLAHLAGLTRLRWLWLSGPSITDTGLAHLEHLNQLSAACI